MAEALEGDDSPYYFDWMPWAWGDDTPYWFWYIMKAEPSEPMMDQVTGTIEMPEMDGTVAAEALNPAKQSEKVSNQIKATVTAPSPSSNGPGGSTGGGSGSESIPTDVIDYVAPAMESPTKVFISTFFKRFGEEAVKTFTPIYEAKDFVEKPSLGTGTALAAGFFPAGKAFKRIKSLTTSSGRLKRLKPHPEATGPHTSFKTDPTTGKVTSYETYSLNAQNPTGFDVVKRVDTQYANPHTHGGIPTPHVHEKGKVRPARSDELPR